MSGRLAKFISGLHFRFLLLVVGFATAMLAAQIFVDTASELQRVRSERITNALNITGVVSRTLESRFDELDLGEVETVLATIASRADVRRLAITDRELAFKLDGDPLTPPIPASDLDDVQLKSLKTGRPEFRVLEDMIEVSEPLVANGRTIGSVIIGFANPGLIETLLPILAAKFTAAIPILVTGLFFAIGLVTQVTSPLRRLSEAARACAEGDLEPDFSIHGAREVRALGDSFALMVSRLRANIERISKIAYVDRTTQLPNREYFYLRLNRALERAQREGTSGAVLFIDLDGFKAVNDTLGHEVGDKLLSGFSERISTVIRSSDTLARQIQVERHRKAPRVGDDGNDEEQTFARLGGDEFTVILLEIREETDAALVAQRIIGETLKPFSIGDTQVRIGASIGIASFPRDGSDGRAILHSADLAMYEAKASGKNTYRFYSAELNRRASGRMELEKSLKAAVERKEFELHYQPKIDCATSRPVGVEALIRWIHPERGLIGPGDFIGIAEKTGLLLPIGQWVLEEACRQLRRFDAAGTDLSIAVNISMQQFEKPEFAREVLRILDENGVSPHRLELEITEQMATRNLQKSLDHIRRLKRAGVRIIVEEFGNGYANLSQLSRLPLDSFKIDISFIEALCDEIDDRGRQIARSVLALANSLHCATIAQGVENEEQFRFLADAGCNYAQGYLFAHPMPAGELELWLSARSLRQLSRSMQEQTRDSQVA